MIIGLYLRHIKAYKGIKFIPIGYEHKFISYVGENGIGKSSILEALDSFFNIKKYTLNKDALADGISTPNNPYVLPIFLIEKVKVTQNKKEFELLSNFFWDIDQKDLASNAKMKDFFDVREKNADKKETHFLLLIGETINLNGTSKIFFGGFHKNRKFLETILEKRVTDVNDGVEDLDILVDKPIWKKTLQYLKECYAYVYLPVELEIESFTKIETQEMQKIFDKNLKGEINQALNGVKLIGADSINVKLDSFVSDIESILNNKYEYKTGVQRGNSVTKTDIIEKIIESYFQKRTLYKDGKRVTELSAGEKRQALIELIYAFLKESKNRDREIIIAIDEPESSLHTSLCYDQFEKLHDISSQSQVLVTTHWYGFLPIMYKGIAHFLNNINQNINFETYDLYDYKARVSKDIESSSNKRPYDLVLKSTNDLVQSIFYSLNKQKPYNWLIVEGVSEKIYFDYFFSNDIEEQNLRVLCMGGNAKVSGLYEYLELPIKENKHLRGKVFCVIDTDIKRHKEHIKDGTANLKIKRLSNKNSYENTVLLSLDHLDCSTCDIEQALHPLIFKETIEKLDVCDKYKIVDIEDINGNTHFIKNLKNIHIEQYFKEDNGSNKILFAKKYVEVMTEKDNPGTYTPKWIKEIKDFFGNS